MLGGGGIYILVSGPVSRLFLFWFVRSLKSFHNLYVVDEDLILFRRFPRIKRSENSKTFIIINESSNVISNITRAML